jgi:hypothetical protein
VQTTATKMNLGFDRNRNNQDKIFYRVSGGFLQTSFQGSLMMRPVFVSCSDPFMGLPEQEVPRVEMQVFPNPAADRFHVQWQGAAQEGARMEVFDATGRLRMQAFVRPGMPVDASVLCNGLYLLRLYDAGGGMLDTGRLIIQR